MNTYFTNINRVILKSTMILVLSVAITSACQERTELTPASQPCEETITKTPEQILIGRSWKVENLQYLIDNTYYYYTRGGQYNTANYAGEYIEFYSNNTGMNCGWDSRNIPFTWNFSNSEKTTIRYTLQSSTPVTVTWDNIVFSEKSIRYTELYSRDGSNYLVAGIRTPK